MNTKMHIKKGDTVVVLSGKDKDKKGNVLFVNPSKRMVIVEGVNIATKHKKPRKAGDPGGIVKQEVPLYASKVMHICPKCGSKTRIGRQVLSDGSIVRSCKKCCEQI